MEKKIKDIFIFSRHETCLSILTAISCNFQFVKTHTHTNTFLQGKLLNFFFNISIVRGENLNP